MPTPQQKSAPTMVYATPGKTPIFTSVDLVKLYYTAFIVG